MTPADSLPGTYAGQYWYANPATNPWTITPDTVFVTNIDSVNCAVWAHDAANFSLLPPSPPDTNYYTDYYSCNGAAPTNFYVKFYSVDSMRLINDNEPQPPPNPPFSMRFYGKRISNKTVGVNELLTKEQIVVYPNPTSTVLSVEYKMFNGTIQVQITDVAGQEVKSVQMNSSQMQIDISSLENGTYFVNLKTDKGIIARKIVVQR